MNSLELVKILENLLRIKEQTDKLQFDTSNNVKIDIANDEIGLATETTLSSINDKLTQFKITEQELSYDNSTGTATANYTVFTNDISIDFNGVIVIQIAINTATTVQLKLTPSGSTTSHTYYINSASSLTANSWYEFEFNVSNGDAINFVIQVPASATLSGYLRIFGRKR